MPEKHLNIITIAIPYPPDYGGIIDIFFRLKYLKKCGIHIHLYCFEYPKNNRKRSDELDNICDSVRYYPRKNGFINMLSSVPYIIKTRRSKQLLNDLNKNDYPILFDGLHTTLYLGHSSLKNRKKAIRLHNIEHNYYKNLARNETNSFKMFYFYLESVKLKHYEKVITKADNLFPISLNDMLYFSSLSDKATLILPFHQFDKVISQPGFGKYILYHANLSVNENIAIIELLIDNVFSKVAYPCIIAGKNPTSHIIEKANRFDNITVMANPSTDTMIDIIRNSHICIVWTTASNGFKIKLLYSLYAGRHCIANSIVTTGSSLKSLCHCADTAEEILRTIDYLKTIPFDEKMISARQELLSKEYENTKNATNLIKHLFG